MSEEDRFKEITKAATDAAATVVVITKKIAEHNIIMNDLSDLASKLGYIMGLSYVPEEEELIENMEMKND